MGEEEEGRGPSVFLVAFLWWFIKELVERHAEGSQPLASLSNKYLLLRFLVRISCHLVAWLQCICIFICIELIKVIRVWPLNPAAGNVSPHNYRGPAGFSATDGSVWSSSTFEAKADVETNVSERQRLKCLDECFEMQCLQSKLWTLSANDLYKSWVRGNEKKRRRYIEVYGNIVIPLKVTFYINHRVILRVV